MHEKPAPTSLAPASKPAPAISVSGMKVQTGKTKDGRCYVKVIGGKDEAEAVRMGYERDGKTPGPLKPDRFTKGAWFFYVDVTA